MLSCLCVCEGDKQLKNDRLILMALKTKNAHSSDRVVLIGVLLMKLATAALRASAARAGSKGDIIDIMYRYWPK